MRRSCYKCRANLPSLLVGVRSHTLFGVSCRDNVFNLFTLRNTDRCKVKLGGNFLIAAAIQSLSEVGWAWLNPLGITNLPGFVKVYLSLWAVPFRALTRDFLYFFFRFLDGKSKGIFLIYCCYLFFCDPRFGLL